MLFETIYNLYRCGRCAYFINIFLKTQIKRYGYVFLYIFHWPWVKYGNILLLTTRIHLLLPHVNNNTYNILYKKKLVPTLIFLRYFTMMHIIPILTAYNYLSFGGKNIVMEKLTVIKYRIIFVYVCT